MWEGLCGHLAPRGGREGPWKWGEAPHCLSFESSSRLGSDFPRKSRVLGWPSPQSVCLRGRGWDGPGVGPPCLRVQSVMRKGRVCVLSVWVLCRHGTYEVPRQTLFRTRVTVQGPLRGAGAQPQTCKERVFRQEQAGRADGSSQSGHIG